MTEYRIHGVNLALPMLLATYYAVLRAHFLFVSNDKAMCNLMDLTHVRCIIVIIYDADFTWDPFY